MSVTSAEVHGIVVRYTAPINATLSSHESAIADLTNRVAELEEELRRAAAAIENMNNNLAAKLDHVWDAQQKSIAAQGITNTQLAGANVQLGVLHSTSKEGFVATSQRLEWVNGSVKEVTLAMSQMEVIKTINDARDPIERIKGFVTEIEERFGKAIENVHIVRGQYDQLLAIQMSEYERKLRVIGEHIYAIYDHDFRAHAEVPLTVPSATYVALPMRLDDARLEAREAALESCLEEASSMGLEPLLELHGKLEHEIASRFAATASARVGAACVPIDLCVFEPGSGISTQVVTGARVAPNAEGDGVRFDIADAADGLQAQLAPHGARLERMTRLRAMSEDEQSALRAELEKMAEEGLVDPELVVGYGDYLTTYGLEVADGGQR